MEGLRQRLQEALAPPSCIVGIGGDGLGDDALGMCLAGDLAAEGLPDVVAAGTAPEDHAWSIAEAGYRSVLCIDAVDFGGAPGAVVLLDCAGIVSRFPQVSTHRISLGALARLIESHPPARVRLLGVQPGSLRSGAGLSEPVRDTLEILKRLILEAARPCGASGRERVCRP